MRWIKIIRFKEIKLPLVDLGFTYNGQTLYLPLINDDKNVDISFIKLNAEKKEMQKEEYRIIPQPLIVLNAEKVEERKIPLKEKRYVKLFEKIKRRKLTEKDLKILSFYGI